jgi:glycosyltransferase involved in cell wall biosynthesis
MSARRVLFVAPQVPFPLDTGGKIRTFYQLKALSERFAVDLLALDAAREIEDPLWREVEGRLGGVWSAPREGLRRRGALLAAARGLVGPLPYPVEKYRSAQAAMMIEELSAGGRYDAVHFDSLHTFRFAGSVRGGARKVLDEHNVEALILERMAKVEGSWAKRRLIEGQARRTARFERESAARADRVLLCSQEDLALLAAQGAPRERLEVIPNGVDVGRFSREGLGEGAASAAPYVMFLGSLDWWPNVDGIMWFLETTWPQIHAANPGLRCKIVGRNSPPSLSRRSQAGVEVLGGVPDVRPWIAGCAAFVVPLRVGGGTRLKILEALSMEAAVISTRVGAEGIAVEEGRELLLADEPGEIARAVARVCGDAALARGLGWRGRRLVEDRYSWAAIGRRLCEVYEEMWGGA